MTHRPSGSVPPPEGSTPAPQLPPPVDEAGATEPAIALADVWDLLDVLPAAAGSPDLLATTIEMAAVSTGGTARSDGPARSGRGFRAGGKAPRMTAGQTVRRWLPAAAIVLGCLGVGIAAGRATAPNPDSIILASLPVVQHLDLIREAGSVAFLEAVAKAGYPPPRRPPLVQSKADALEDASEFDAAIRSLRAGGGVAVDKETVARRREQVLRMTAAERRKLERAAEAFASLSGADRGELVAVGRALADPGREQFLKAARTWHLWVQLRDPADRRDVIELSTEDRLEWLDRVTRLGARFDTRLDGRDSGRAPFEREWDNRRRPPPEFRWDDHPRPPGPPRPRGPGRGPGPDGDADREGRFPGGFNGREQRPPRETQAPPS